MNRQCHNEFSVSLKHDKIKINYTIQDAPNRHASLLGEEYMRGGSV